MHDQFNWDDMRFFLCAAREGGFGAAARKLKTQQSTVSRRVASLERLLGAVLFDRASHGLGLTSLGHRVLVQAETMEAALTHVGNAASATESRVEGVVRLALTQTVASVLVIPQVLPPLLKAHPKLKIDLVVGDGVADLARREADVALRFFLMPRGDLVTKRIARLRTAVMAEPALAMTLKQKPVQEWPFVAVSLHAGLPPEEGWRVALSANQVRITTNSFHTQLDTLRAGLGVAVLPELLGEALGLCSVSLPATVPPTPNVDLFVVTPRALRRVPRVAVVFDALTRVFGD